MEIHISNIENIREAAHAFLPLAQKHKIIAFYGGMGAGKTTFIKALCDEMGVTDTVTSPSFAIINEYSLPDQKKIFHFDFYRIKKQSEVFDLGYEDYFYSGQWNFIEWPELIEELLPEETLRVKIEVQPDGCRLLII